MWSGELEDAFVKSFASRSLLYIQIYSLCLCIDFCFMASLSILFQVYVPLVDLIKGTLIIPGTPTTKESGKCSSFLPASAVHEAQLKEFGIDG